MIDEDLKRKVVAGIFQSPEFKDSKRSQELLQYLLEATEAQKNPKESTIAIEFFGKDGSFDPKEDPTVRVQINHLRKKLEHYYLTTPDSPPCRLEIPKGHYTVQFRPVAIHPKQPHDSKRTPILLSLVIVALAITVVGLLLERNRDPITANSSIKQSRIWREFFHKPGKPTLVVLGDYFFLYERTHDGSIGNFVRNLNINTMDDFKAKVKTDPSFAERFVQSDFTFLRPSSSWGVTQILPVLQELPNGYSLKLASRFTVDDFKTNNVIFIGSFKTLYSLHKFLHIFGLEYELSPNRFEVRGNNGDSTLVFSPKQITGGNYEKDYAVVAKGTGPEGSSILLLLGFADSGVIEASKAVTDRQIVDSILKNVDEDATPDLRFTLVVETEGFNQAIFNSKIVHFVKHHSSEAQARVK